MKKSQLFVLLPVIMLLLALADYRVNTPEGLSLPATPRMPGTEDGGVIPVVRADPNVTQEVLEATPDLAAYRIEKRTRSLELFEIFDLSQMTNTLIYKNVVLDKTDPNGFPIYIYEAQGQPGQGKITFLNLKSIMIKQGSSVSINETNDFGQSSLFYNDSFNPSNGFLLVQVNDNVFGFKYFKTSDQIFKDIQTFIATQMSPLTQ